MKISRMTTDDHIQLWDRFRLGNHDAFATLYELFAPDLYQYGYNIVRNKPLIEDALQELFLSLYHNKAKLGNTTNIRFYLYRAFRNKIMDLLNNSKRMQSDLFIEQEDTFLLQSDEHAWMEEEFFDWQKTLLMKELNNLPKRQKEILYLIYIQGMSYEETATIMDISPKTVLNGVKVALATLQKYVLPVFKRNGVLSIFFTAIYNLLTCQYFYN